MGLENLIIAMQSVVEKFPNVFLIIGGDGPLKRNLIKITRLLELQNHIQFTGFINEDKLPMYYRLADLFVLPTEELEGFGLVTVESMIGGSCFDLEC